MEVKGTAIATIPKFVMEKFGEAGYNKWFQALKPEAKEIYQWKILSNGWFPLGAAMTEPTQLICDLFYNGDLRGASECGSYSADFGLKGIYRFFIQFGSPEFIIKRAGIIMPTYYRPSKMETTNLEKGRAVFRITEFPEPSKVVEFRIIGWIKRALEISGSRYVKVDLTKSMTDNNPYSELTTAWQ